MPEIVKGLCQCGCGEAVPIARRTDVRNGWVKGEPMRYRRGHNTRLSPVEYIEDESGCWIWQRARYSTGYGVVRLNGRMAHAHRIVFERHNGPVPEGLELDHLCGVRACVNPLHLEPVTHAENIRRCRITKLDEGKVSEIRRRVASGERTLLIAEEFGVTQRNVHHIVNRETWADVA